MGKHIIPLKKPTINIFSYQDCKKFIYDSIECNKVSLRTAATSLHLNVSTLSRIINGDRSISDETMKKLIRYFNLDKKEKKVFINLILYNRAKETINKINASYSQL